MASTGEICVLPGPVGTPALGAPRGWTVVDGRPEARAWRSYASDDGRIVSGTWSSTVGSYRVEYDRSEFCHIKSGSCSITSDDGETSDLHAGQSFLVPKGFKGVWTVREDMEKSYVFMDVA